MIVVCVMSANRKYSHLSVGSGSNLKVISKTRGIGTTVTLRGQTPISQFRCFRICISYDGYAAKDTSHCSGQESVHGQEK